MYTTDKIYGHQLVGEINADTHREIQKQEETIRYTESLKQVRIK
jgi:hypothetical protein